MRRVPQRLDGLVLVAALLSLWAAVHAVAAAWPRPTVQSRAACVVPIAWQDGDQVLLGCADTSAARRLNARTDDVLHRQDGAWHRLPGGLSTAWRLVLGRPIDLNRTSAAGLAQVPGLGPVRAAALVAARQRQAGFTDVEALAAVPGVGPGTLARLRPLLQVLPDPG